MEMVRIKMIFFPHLLLPTGETPSYSLTDSQEGSLFEEIFILLVENPQVTRHATYK